MSNESSRTETEEISVTAMGNIAAAGAIPIDKLPKDMQDMAMKFDVDGSGTLDFLELAQVIEKCRSQDDTIASQKKKLIVQSFLGCLLLVAVFVLSLVSAYMSKEMRADGDDGTMRSTDANHTIVRTGSSDMDLSSGGDMLVHKPACPASYAEEQKLKGAGNVAEANLNRRLTQNMSHRRLGEISEECAKRTEEASQYQELDKDASPSFAGEQQIMGCRRKTAQRTVSSRIPDEYLREMESMTLTVSEATVSLKVLTIVRTHDLVASCGSKVSILTSSGAIIFDDHKITLSEKLKEDLAELGVKDFQWNLGEMAASGTFNDIGAFELTCDNAGK